MSRDFYTPGDRRPEDDPKKPMEGKIWKWIWRVFVTCFIFVATVGFLAEIFKMGPSGWLLMFVIGIVIYLFIKLDEQDMRNQVEKQERRNQREDQWWEEQMRGPEKPEEQNKQ